MNNENIRNILEIALDKFLYACIINTNEYKLISFEKIMKEKNFVKYIKEINEVFEFSANIVEDDELKTMMTKSDNFKLIKMHVLKYINIYYLLLNFHVLSENVSTIQFQNQLELISNQL